MVNMFILCTLGLMLLFVAKEVYSLIKSQVEEIESTKEVIRLSGIIKKSAITYLFSQLKVLIVVEILIAAALYAFLNVYIMAAFIIGATLSWLSGFLAMYFSVTYNKKVALDAIKGYESAFLSAFSVGKTVSLLVNYLALVTCYGAYIYSVHYAPNKLMEILIGLSFGSSLISIFARIGGGIFTKGADIGADLVGKIESSLNEDDPRNPAVIADAVGDNVGDACGMSADLFETFVVITTAAIAIVSALSKSFNNFNIELIFIILAAGAISGMLVLLTGWTFNEEDLFSSLGIAMKTLFISVIVISSSVYMCFYKTNLFSQIYCYHAVLATIIGIIASVLVMLITEYYTSAKFSSVLKIVSASKQGAANNILQGLAIGYRAVFVNILLISIALLASYKCTESLAGIAFACTGMISICSVILALDVFGPVTDNAGGLVEMSKLGEEIRKTTDKLDAIGNMTKATTKGYSIFSAGLAAYILLLVFFADYQFLNKDIPLNCCLDNMYVFIGLFIGVAVISLFASQCLMSVNKVSITIMEEARHQLKNINNSDFVPDYNKAIEILTFASLREMIIPALMPVISCIVLFYSILFYVDKISAFLALVGFIVGSTLAGIYTSISMTVSGGAWDNAKKHLEIIGQKDSEEHKSSVIGDTVGDPFKDTAGPSFNPLIKLIGIVCILILKALF